VTPIHKQEEQGVSPPTQVFPEQTQLATSCIASVCFLSSAQKEAKFVYVKRVQRTYSQFTYTEGFTMVDLMKMLPLTHKYLYILTNLPVVAGYT